ncbi:hypothetical protein FHS27_003914 [Rhodopirellula rubra]|uniref:Inosine/uridine-preferring nucleoside hydrolase domain-containing protein n=1 Tax=Aporhodopirellula rubra TaxID=980271 RepID=A0A7W5H623_9BACT|nr:nucleoside hydrolase [Aporhodopirellula rubra]MBB3208087.1 hypothetical protein [Aporhodopirellula rubra]
MLPTLPKAKTPILFATFALASCFTAICVPAICFPAIYVSTCDAAQPPLPVIFDTDMGNDCDDVLALGMIHALQSRGECQLVAVTITKDHALAAPFVDAVNTFYSNGNIPIGVCRSGITDHEGRFNGLAEARDDGELRYPHDLASGENAPDAVAVLRRALATADDHSVAVIQVGFSTNLAALLASAPDEISPLNGVELVTTKVSSLSMMAGAFAKIKDESGHPRDYKEYNVIKDIPAAQRIASEWPTPIAWSGFEVGIALPYPHRSIENDFGCVEHHPLREAYVHYNPPPHDRPTWDLTSVLHAIRPDHGYFRLSDPGTVTVDDEAFTTFQHEATGKHRYLIVDEASKSKTLEAFQLLSSEPPKAR